MINLAAFTKPIIKISFCVIVSAMVMQLQGCGGQRDEPFNGSTSSSSRGAVISTRELTVGEDLPSTTTDVDVDVKGTLKSISDVDNFTKLWRLYTLAAQPDLDWAVGQVVLIDLGKKRVCDRTLTLKKVSAFEESVNSVALVIDYNDRDRQNSSASSVSSSTSSSSSSFVCNDTRQTQPFYFYYVKTRDQIIFEENVP